VAAAFAAAAALAVAGCGSGGGGSGPAQLNFFIFPEPSGAVEQAAQSCSQQSGGRYNIVFQFLPREADGQREQLVRRLGAQDSSVDIIGMDVIWTGEFANAGWIKPVPEDLAQEVQQQTFRSVLDTAKFQGRLYGVPSWTNTQLLWYRKDRVPRPPQTWDQMIQMAEKIGPQGKIQVQGNRYEGLVVWVNAMIESAGTQILRGPTELALAPDPTKLALATMGKLGRSSAAPTDLSTSTEDSARLGFESGDSSFMINYPFVYPSAKENAPEVFKNLGEARYPRVDPSKPSRPPLGGINLGVGAYSKNPDVAFQAIRCLVRRQNQLTYARLGGLPPVNPALYDEPALTKEIYPGFAGLMRESIEAAAARPSESPAYQDISLAIQTAVHPVSGIDPQNPTPTYDDLRSLLERAVNREGLL
jgi:multiple sugar transport system substrate-binding protein